MRIQTYDFKQARSGMTGPDHEVWTYANIDICANHAWGKKQPWIAVNRHHDTVLRGKRCRVRTFATKEAAARAAVKAWLSP